MVFLSNAACTSTAPITHVTEAPQSKNILVVYEDGRMELNARYVNAEDVVIYDDGKGGERAAVKVRVPIHPDFYRDSIIVVRVKKQYENAIADEQSNGLDTGIIN